MGLTRYPNGIFATPVVGASVGFGWKGDAKSYFVDGTNGSDGNSGLDPGNAFSTIQNAINTADKHDVIYVFDKDGETYNQDTVKYTENLNVTKEKHNLSIVGCSQLLGKPIRECRIRNTGVSPVLTVGAASLTLENLAFTFNTGATYGIYAASGEEATNYGYNPVIYNCRFNGFTAGAAVYGVGLQGMQIYNSLFVDNLVSIHIVSGVATCTDIIIDGNFFGCNDVATTLISADIQINTQGSSYLVITNNYFAHILPAGAIGRYITVADTRQGIISNNHFGHSATLTQGAGGSGIVCPDNVGHGANYCCAAIMAEGN